MLSCCVARKKAPQNQSGALYATSSSCKDLLQEPIKSGNPSIRCLRFPNSIGVRKALKTIKHHTRVGCKTNPITKQWVKKGPSRPYISCPRFVSQVGFIATAILAPQEYGVHRRALKVKSSHVISSPRYLLIDNLHKSFSSEVRSQEAFERGSSGQLPQYLPK